MIYYNERWFVSVIESEGHFCIQHEMTLTLVDFFVNRTGYMYCNIFKVVKNLEIIGQVFANHYNWSAETLAKEIDSVQTEINNRSQFN